MSLRLILVISACAAFFAVIADGPLRDWRCRNLVKGYRESYLLHVELGNVPRPASSTNALRGSGRMCYYSTPLGLVVEIPSGDKLRYRAIKRINSHPTLPNLRYDFQFRYGRDTSGNLITNAP